MPSAIISVSAMIIYFIVLGSLKLFLNQFGMIIFIAIEYMNLIDPNI